MPKHDNIYIHSTQLIEILGEDYGLEELAAMIGVTYTKDGDEVEVNDPSLWYVVKWPEHVRTPQFNDDASYLQVDAVDALANLEHVHESSRHYMPKE